MKLKKIVEVVICRTTESSKFLMFPNTSTQNLTLEVIYHHFDEFCFKLDFTNKNKGHIITFRHKSKKT